MFEIGNSLKEARLRRGVDLARAEAATKIRGKYLRALEEEQFDVLPAQTYVKGFIRSYAEYLGLDGQLYVDEYNSRFVAAEEHEPHARRSAARPQRRNRRFETGVILFALTVIAALMIVVIAAWKSVGDRSRTAAPTRPSRSAAPRTVPPLLLIVPRRGTTRVTVRLSSAAGAVRYDGAIRRGDDPVAIRTSRRLWVRIGSPGNVIVSIRGRRVRANLGRPVVRIVTATGWRRA